MCPSTTGQIQVLQKVPLYQGFFLLYTLTGWARARSAYSSTSELAPEKTGASPVGSIQNRLPKSRFFSFQIFFYY